MPLRPSFLSSASVSSLVISGRLSVADGSAAAPSLCFTSDPDTGFFRSGANSFGFTAGGTEVASVNTAGLCPRGIGIYGQTSALAGGLGLGAAGEVRWGAPADVGLQRSAAGALKVTDASTGNGTLSCGALTVNGQLSIPSFNVTVNGAGVGAGRFGSLSNGPVFLAGNQADGATSVATAIDAVNGYTTPGALLLSVRNGGVEKANIDKDGDLSVAGTATIGTGTIATPSPTDDVLVIKTTSNGGNILFGVGNATPQYASFLAGNQSSRAAGVFRFSYVNTRWEITAAGGGTVLFSVSGASGKASFDATDSSGTPGAVTINKPSGQVAVANGASSVVVTNSLVSATSVVTAVLQDVTDAVQIKGVVPAAGSFTIHLTGAVTGDRKVGFVVFN